MPVTHDPRTFAEPTMNARPRLTLRLRRAALSAAVATACLGMGAAAAQEARHSGHHGGGECRTEARGRFDDRCASDARAVEIDGRDHLPATAERELPRLSVVLGDARALRETTERRQDTVPGAAAPRDGAHTARFDSGADLLLDSDRQRLDQIVAQVKGRDALRFQIVGHTDVQPIGPRLRPRFADNHALGLARAHQVGRYLAERLGLPETAFTYASKGPDEPLATPREDRAHWAANRRVEVHAWWTDQAPPTTVVHTTVRRSDPSECHMLSPYGSDDAPLRLTVDGAPLIGADASSADRQRCIDVQLERHQLRLQVDSLSQPRRLNAAAWPTTVAPGDTVRFAGHSNYLLFLHKAELRLFTLNAGGQRQPLATVALDANLRGEWTVPSGLLEGQGAARDGQLVYRLRVFDAQGRFDETEDFSLTLAARRPEAAQPHEPERELLRGYGDSRLAVSHIPIRAGTVTASGQAIRPDQRVRALGHAVPVDPNGRFVFQQLVPRRVQTGEIAVLEADGSARVYRRDFEIPKQDGFFIGQADLTLGRQRVSGPAALLTMDPNRQDGGSWSEGRLAFYTKRQLDERWTFTASLDTEERPLNELFRNLDRKDPSTLFRRLDPVDSWATFGDDSTTVEDAPTQGRVYARIDDGRSHAMWGNYKLNLDETALAQISRGLYGLHGRYLSEDSTAHGEARLRVDAYAAEPGTLSAREEFRGTGGSLYYLRHQDITRGAERVFVEIRDRDSGLVRTRRLLVPGSDYEVDHLQGRVLLNGPLPSFSDDGAIVRAGGLTGLPTYLVVDYEYAPLLGSLDTLATGGRLSWWASDALRLGVTASKQEQTGGDQTLAGVDLLLRHGENTYLKAEVARSDGPGTGELRSLDGGYHFAGEPVDPTADANAWRLEGQADLKDLGLAGGGRIAAYAQRRGAGFSAPGQLVSNETQQVGVDAALPLGERTELRLKADRRDERNGFDSDSAEAQLSHQLTPHWRLGASLRRDDKRSDSVVTNGGLPWGAAVEGERTDLGVQLDYDSLASWALYGFAQRTLSRSGTRLDNDRLGVGARYRVNDKLALNGELSGGDGGAAGRLGVDYQYDDRSSLYLTYVLDTGRTDENTQGRGGTLVSGAKSRINEGLSVFTEHRHSVGTQPGLTHAYGVQYAPDSRWTLGVSLENGRVGVETLGELRREAIAFNAGYSSDTVRYSGGAEYRSDRGSVESRRSWLLKNAFSLKDGEDARWVGKFNWADSDSSAGALAAAKYTEASLGYALRPVNNDRLNLLLKYTYLHDLSSPGQVSVTGVSSTQVFTTGNDYQQRSHVWAADLSYDLTPRWTLGGKVAWRLGELRASRDNSAPWFKSSADLAVLRLDWKVVRRWDWLLELRSLRAKELGDRRTGWLTAGYYHINENVKLGLGYNFTDFSDDLTDMRYRSRGWFINLLGKF
ncbi:OmpA family protein [Hydrogenophaga borbori]|jgi:outer membrane protein OmpA-like peptidoglycan-associated protein|uniref:OmpA family protein n=2 Tax=Hydrogenophaga borbori TaxID=2294117 RepID=A0A372EHQ9_9BURK|nr:OmpA family protein [Hydrogenophaga borbori]